MINILLFFIVAVLFSGCSGSYSHMVYFSPNEPLRVAVLPFKQIDENGNIVEESGSLIVDEIPLISSEVANSPTSITRKMVLAELNRTNFDIISPALIDIDIPHRNLAHPDGKFDLEKIFSVPARVYCGDFLNCDAVLFGTIRKWNRNYYGIESQNEIEVELKLVSAVSEKVLYHSIGSDSESRGISKGPTGYSSLIIEPLKGLDSELVEDMARRVISRMLDPLKVSRFGSTGDTAPPAIFAASHDSRDGSINPGKSLLVLAFGTPKCLASFSIGNYQRNIPMFEKSPGHYVGEFWPLPEQMFLNQPVTVKLKDAIGRNTFLQLDSGNVSLRN